MKFGILLLVHVSVGKSKKVNIFYCSIPKILNRGTCFNEDFFFDILKTNDKAKLPDFKIERSKLKGFYFFALFYKR